MAKKKAVKKVAVKKVNVEKVQKGQEVVTFQKDIKKLVTKVSKFDITSEKDVDMCIATLQHLKKMEKKIETFFEPLTQATHLAHKTLCNGRNELLYPIQESLRDLKDKKTDWDIAQEAIERKKREAAEEKARKIEDKKRKALEKKLQKEKDEEKKAEIEEKIEQVHEPIKYAKPIKSKSVVAVEHITIEIVDKRKLLAAIVKGDVKVNLDKLLTFKLETLKTYVTMSGITSIPGCKIEKTFIQRVGRG